MVEACAMSASDNSIAFLQFHGQALRAGIVVSVPETTLDSNS